MVYHHDQMIAIKITSLLGALAICGCLVVHHMDLIYISYYKCKPPQPSDSSNVVLYKNIAIWLANHNWPLYHPDIELSLIATVIVCAFTSIGIAIGKCW